jgi:hypothetical protein
MLLSSRLRSMLQKLSFVTSSEVEKARWKTSKIQYSVKYKIDFRSSLFYVLKTKYTTTTFKTMSNGIPILNIGLAAL